MISNKLSAKWGVRDVQPFDACCWEAGGLKLLLAANAAFTFFSLSACATATSCFMLIKLSRELVILPSWNENQTQNVSPVNGAFGCSGMLAGFSCASKKASPGAVAISPS